MPESKAIVPEGGKLIANSKNVAECREELIPDSELTMKSFFTL